MKDSIPTHNSAVVLMDLHLPNEGKQQHPVKASKPNTLSTKKGVASYVEVISTALMTSRKQKLLVSELDESINRRWPQFSLKESTWKKGVRHTLSSNSFFTQSGRGLNGRVCYWSVHPACESMFRQGDFHRREARRRVQNIQRKNTSLNQQEKTLGCSQSITNDMRSTGAQIQSPAFTTSNAQSSITDLNYSSCPSMSSNATFNSYISFSVKFSFINNSSIITFLNNCSINFYDKAASLLAFSFSLSSCDVSDDGS